MLPSGKLSHNYGKSPCLMGKSTISMAIFHSYVSLPEGNSSPLFLLAGDGLHASIAALRTGARPRARGDATRGETIGENATVIVEHTHW